MVIAHFAEIYLGEARAKVLNFEDLDGPGGMRTHLSANPILAIN